MEGVVQVGGRLAGAFKSHSAFSGTRNSVQNPVNGILHESLRYPKYAREKKMPLGRLPIEDRPLESFRPPETEPFKSFMARYRLM